MKKSLLILGLLIGSMTATKAQCTIVNSCTPTNGYCSSPAVATSLPNGTENVAYSTTIQVSLASTYSIATITNATVTAVTGTPSGITGTTNPSNGVINGGANGCILLSGTPGTGTAGTYTVNAAVTLNTNFGTFPATLSWGLTIDPATGIAQQSANVGTLLIMPNPAGSELHLNADFHFQKATIFDALGNMVISQQVNSSYTTTIDLQKLTAGVYFVQIMDGNKILTRKFFKE